MRQETVWRYLREYRVHLHEHAGRERRVGSPRQRTLLDVVLRVNGATFDPRACLRTSAMTACTGHIRGQPRRKTRPDGERHDDSGFVVSVSEASWSNLAEQARDAVTFIVTHQAELAALAAMPEVEDTRLDFPVFRRDVFVQCELLPRDLVALAGQVGLALEPSLYPEADDGDDDEAADDASVDPS